MQPVFEEELLSAYLDNELSAEQRHVVEERLAVDPLMREALSALRRVRGLVAELPGWTGPDLVISTAQLAGSNDKPNLPQLPANSSTISKQPGELDSRWFKGRFFSSRPMAALAAGLAAVALFFPYWFGRRPTTDLASVQESRPPAAIALDMPTDMEALADAANRVGQPSSSADLGRAASANTPASPSPMVALQAEMRQQSDSPSGANSAAQPNESATSEAGRAELSAKDGQRLLELSGSAPGLPSMAERPSAPALPTPTSEGMVPVGDQRLLAERKSALNALATEAVGGLAGASRQAAPTPAAISPSSERAVADQMNKVSSGSMSAPASPLSTKYWILRSSSWTADEAQRQLAQIASVLEPVAQADKSRMADAETKSAPRNVLIGLVSLAESGTPTAWIDSLRMQLPNIPWLVSEPAGAVASSANGTLVCFANLAEARQILVANQSGQLPGAPRGGSVRELESLPPAWWLLPPGLKAAGGPLDETQPVILVITLTR